MPAYNAAKTLRQTYDEVMAQGIVDQVIVVDDASHDETAAIAKKLRNTIVYTHQENRGYGGNQKTCYKMALEAGADIVIMVHPDYQYDPTLLPQIIRPIQENQADVVLGSRLLGANALAQGMPWWKYYSNRFLTMLENRAFGLNLAEYHTGYRAFRREVLEQVNLQMNSDAFIFDQEIMAQIDELEGPVRRHEGREGEQPERWERSSGADHGHDVSIAPE